MDTQDIVTEGSFVALVNVLMAVVKSKLPVYLNWTLPLFSMLIGVALVFLAKPQTTWQVSTFLGITYGLVASGLYRTKRVVLDGQ